MQAITLQRPWPSAITHGTPAMGCKRVENRSWELPTRLAGTPVLLHSGTGYDRMARFLIPQDDMAAWPDVEKAVVAVVTFTGCHRAENGCCTPWGAPNVYHWEISDNVTILPEPVPVPGRLLFWNPPASVLEAVTAQLETA